MNINRISIVVVPKEDMKSQGAILRSQERLWDLVKDSEITGYDSVISGRVWDLWVRSEIPWYNSENSGKVLRTQGGLWDLREDYEISEMDMRSQGTILRTQGGVWDIREGSEISGGFWGLREGSEISGYDFVNIGQAYEISGRVLRSQGTIMRSQVDSETSRKVLSFQNSIIEWGKGSVISG